MSVFLKCACGKDRYWEEVKIFPRRENGEPRKDLGVIVYRCLFCGAIQDRK